MKARGMDDGARDLMAFCSLQRSASRDAQSDRIGSPLIAQSDMFMRRLAASLFCFVCLFDVFVFVSPSFRWRASLHCHCGQSSFEIVGAVVLWFMPRFLGWDRHLMLMWWNWAAECVNVILRVACKREDSHWLTKGIQEALFLHVPIENGLLLSTTIGASRKEQKGPKTKSIR
ncbi:hypothetical protein HDV57DRAFT_21888 [Trichoderma longibrachiatum]